MGLYEESHEAVETAEKARNQYELDCIAKDRIEAKTMVVRWASRLFIDKYIDSITITEFKPAILGSWVSDRKPFEATLSWMMDGHEFTMTTKEFCVWITIAVDNDGNTERRDARDMTAIASALKAEKSLIEHGPSV